MTETENITSTITSKPKVDFEDGISLNYRTEGGLKANEVIKGLPEEMQKCVSYSIELSIKDESAGEQIVSALESVKEMVCGMIPGISEVLESGLNVSFRYIGKSIFVDVCFSGDMLEKVKSEIEKVLKDKLEFGDKSFETEFHMISGVKLDNVLETTYEDLLRSACNFKFELTSNANKELAKSVFSFVKDNFLSSNDKMKKLFCLVKLFLSLNKFNFEQTYDSDLFYTYVRELIGKIVHNTKGEGDLDDLNSEIGTQIVSSTLASGQEMANMQLGMVKGMLDTFLEPYKQQLKMIKFDDIGINLYIINMSIHLKLNICLVGLTDFLNKNIFNEES